MSALKGCAMIFTVKGQEYKSNMCLHLRFLHYGQHQTALLSGIGTVLCINNDRINNDLVLDCFLLKKFAGLQENP